jgi:hypothetical protein
MARNALVQQVAIESFRGFGALTGLALENIEGKLRAGRSCFLSRHPV